MCYHLSTILQYLHTPDPFTNKKVIVHRDVKPENIVVRRAPQPLLFTLLCISFSLEIDKDFNVHLCDFGDSEESNEGKLGSLAGGR